MLLPLLPFLIDGPKRENNRPEVSVAEWDSNPFLSQSLEGKQKPPGFPECLVGVSPSETSECCSFSFSLLSGVAPECSFFAFVLKPLPSPPKALAPAYSSGLDSGTSEASLWP